MKKENQYKITFSICTLIICLFSAFLILAKNTKYVQVPIQTSLLFTLLITIILILVSWWQAFFNVDSIFFNSENEYLFLILHIVISSIFIYFSKQILMIIPLIISFILWIISKIIIVSFKNKPFVNAKVISFSEKKFVSGGIAVKNYTYYSYILEDLNNKNIKYEIKNKLIKLDVDQKLSGVKKNNSVYWDFR